MRLCHWMLWGLIAAVTVLGWTAVQWLGGRFDQAKQDAAARSDSIVATLQTVQRDASAALALARDQADTIAQLQAALAQAQRRYQALEARPPVSADADEAIRLNNIEHLVRQADQQLRLGGQVRSAIIALDIALSRLTLAEGEVERPEQVLLRQALEDDLMRLRVVPVVDVAARVAQVERLIALVARAPLLVADVVSNGVAIHGGVAVVQFDPSDAVSEAAGALDPSTTWWQRASRRVTAWGARTVSGLGRDLRGLVSVQRVADPNALLLAPDQAVQLRATLRMRLLAAQVALLLGQANVWQNELAAVSTALATYYDAHAPETAAAVQLARELLDVSVAAQIPDIAASLKAVAVLRAAYAYAPTGSSVREDND